MAADIYNTSGNAGGYQKLGNPTVATGAKTPKSSTTHQTEVISVTGISDKYEDRFDDPTFY